MDYSRQDIYNIINKIENDVELPETNQIEELSISTETDPTSNDDGCLCGDSDGGFDETANNVVNDNDTTSVEDANTHVDDENSRIDADNDLIEAENARIEAENARIDENNEDTSSLNSVERLEDSAWGPEDETKYSVSLDNEPGDPPYPVNEDDVHNAIQEEQERMQLMAANVKVETELAATIIHQNERQSNFHFLDDLWLSEKPGDVNFDDIKMVEIHIRDTTEYNRYRFTGDRAHHVMTNLKIPTMTSYYLLGSYICKNVDITMWPFNNIFYQQDWPWAVAIYTSDEIYVADRWSLTPVVNETHREVIKPHCFTRLKRNPRNRFELRN